MREEDPSSSFARRDSEVVAPLLELGDTSVLNLGEACRVTIALDLPYESN